MDQPWECTTSPLAAFEEVAKNKLAPFPIIIHLQPYLIACPWRRYLQCKRGHHHTLPDTKSGSVSIDIQIHLRTTWKYQYSTKKLSWDVCWYIKKSPQCEIDVNQKFPGPIFLTFSRNYSFHGTNSLIWSSKNDNPVYPVFPSHFFATINSRG